MSNNKLIDGEVIDTYKEHWCHQSFHTDCSSCYSENRLIQAKKTVLGRPLSAKFSNPLGENLPLGYREND